MSALKRSVFVGFVLLALVPLMDAACWTMLHKSDVTHCEDSTDNSLHEVGSSWTNSDCMDCSCSLESMSCCNRLPTVHPPPDCIVEYDYDTCTYKVFKKNDRRVSCSYSAVGK